MEAKFDINKAIHQYQPMQFAASWMDGAKESFNDDDNDIIYRISAAVLQGFAGVVCFFGEIFLTIVHELHALGYTDKVDINVNINLNDSRQSHNEYHNKVKINNNQTQNNNNNNNNFGKYTPFNTADNAGIVGGVGITQEAKFEPAIVKTKNTVVHAQEVGKVGIVGNVPAPWGFKPLSILDDGVMFTQETHRKHPDGTIPGKFTNDPELCRSKGETEQNSFQKRHGVKFPLLLSAEAPVNASNQIKTAAGIPVGAVAYQFIYPGSLNMQFDDPSLDTPANREKIIEAIKEELREELQALLLIGGFMYFAELTWPKDRPRYLAGINVLVPGGNPLDPGYKHLYFGQARLVPPSVVNGFEYDSKDGTKKKCVGIEAWANGTNNYYNTEITKKKLTDYPGMCKITVGPLLEKGITHFKWLEQGHPIIEEVKKDIRNSGRKNAQQEAANFGNMGAYVYYSEEDSELSCIVPLTDQDSWKKALRGSTYLEMQQQEEADAVKVYLNNEQTDCQVCFCDTTANKINQKVRLTSCGHTDTCQQCVYKLLERDPALCPICRTAFDAFDTDFHQAMAYKSYHEGLDNFQLHLEELAVDYIHNPGGDSGSLDFLLTNDLFRSPTSIMAEPLYIKFPGADATTKAAFLYPIWGKGRDSTCSYLGPIQEAIAQNTANARILKGLVASGGFIVYGENGVTVRSVYAIVPPIAGRDEGDILNLQSSDLASKEDTISTEIVNFKNHKVDKYNVCTVTLQGLLPFAKYFQADLRNGRFIYDAGPGQRKWKAVIV